MLQIFDQNDRRILKFPAVRPCEDISPATLVNSLITLSHSICHYKSKFLSTQKRNTRETIRQIGILSIFFEEIRDRNPILSNSIMLCFSELHLTLQKILFLLEDCTREGAKVWILMKANFITTKFRELIRTVATTLDVLPLNSINVSSEIREVVELVAKQARRAKLELHPDDENAMNLVILVLNQFENKFEPDPSIIKEVLDFLDIRNWSSCQKEIKFLEEEINLEILDGNEREVPLLSSLVGFMSYCRGVLFENSDFGIIDQSNGRFNQEIVSCLNPEDFRCPISLELMTDPVTVSTGQTYDRISIQKWFKSGNLTCPKTGEKLTTTELVPNSTLRKLIHQLCVKNGVSDSKSTKKNHDLSRTIVAGSLAASESIKFLCQFLASRLYYATDEQKNKAAYEIRLLAKSNIFNRSCLIESGTIPPLLILLTSTNPSIQENAIAALLKLSKQPSGKKVIVENGGLNLIIAVLKDGQKLEARQIAAATIFYLSSVHKYRRLIGDSTEVIPALVDLIKNGTICGKKNAVVAIFGLLLYQKNQQKVLEAGTIPLLIDILASSDKTDLITDSLAVIARLAESIDGSTAILQSSALSVIMGILHSSASQAEKEHCVSILLSLCNNCGVDVIVVLVKDTSLTSSLYSLLTDGTSHASKKARSLIKILYKFHERNSSGLMINEVPQEQFIHVR